ncbi:hypothetical protein [Roseisolibacter sp. H3M3-2]|uniref:hypothetical protein n=1 Tax=Roseisolibacter sp. H3M3-2 TaxID=3031323 RepID=UPI0023DA9BDA|nr:hypothetical protein [Roseisolibacter sp. H3M3-2]MDF1504675.1 hypothetical protein [Roseisolibacter sp. H3M3-2]
MTRVAARLELALTAEQCVHAVQASMDDPRVREAFRALRPGKEYAGWVTHVEPGRRLEIAYAALDPMTNKRIHRLGWRVTYDFAPAGAGRTRVEVGVEYGRLAALGGMGLMRAQAENEVARRLSALHMLELGARLAAGGDAEVAQEALGAGPAHVGFPTAAAREAAR